MEDKNEKNEWKFNKDTRMITGTGKLDAFSFMLERQKDGETKEENLVIQANYNDDYYGEIVSSISTLNTNIVKLQDVGIVLAWQYYIELAQKIKNNFYSLPLNIVKGLRNRVPEEKLLQLVRHFKEYIIENKIEEKDGCFNIEVGEFSKEFNNNMFKYEEREYREALRIWGYTKCNGTSFTHVVKLDGKKSVKCISFFADKINAVEEESYE